MCRPLIVLAIASCVTLPPHARAQTPPAPTNAVAEATGSASVRLTWAFSGTATSFRIERDLGCDGGWLSFYNVLGGSTRRVDIPSADLAPPLTPDGSMAFRVVALNGAAAGAPSNSDCVRFLAAPTNLSLTPQTDCHQMRLGWRDNSTRETGFVIERRAGCSGDNWVLSGLAGANQTSFIVDPLNAATAYSFRIRAVNGDGYSDWSNVDCDTTRDCARADLRVVSVTASPVPAWVDGVVSVTVRIENVGDAPAEGPFFVDLFRDRASAPPNPGTGDDRQSTTTLQPGVPRDLPAFQVSYGSGGTKRLWALVDSAGAITEANEGNNTGPDGGLPLSVDAPRAGVNVTVRERVGDSWQCVDGPELNAVQVFDGGLLVAQIDPAGCTAAFDALQPGRTYQFDAYIDDMYAGSAHATPGPGITAVTIDVPYARCRLGGSVHFTRDSRTYPLEGAAVRLTSHDGNTWRTGRTACDGRILWGGSEAAVSIMPAQAAGESWAVEVEHLGSTYPIPASPFVSTPGAFSDPALAVPLPTYRLPPGRWTVIAHGASFGCDYPCMTAQDGWMGALADRLARIDPADLIVHTMEAGSLSIDGPFSDQAAHHVLLFDWTPTCNLLPGMEGLQNSNFGHAYAAGEALAVALRDHGIDDDVSSMIGYSRGAVVVSEASRRLLAAGRDPGRVIFIDGEGGTLSIFDENYAAFADHLFQAWGAAQGPARFLNVFSEYRDCPVDLGGEPRPSCADVNLGQRFAHAPRFGLCLPQPPPIYQFLIDDVAYDGARLTLPGDRACPSAGPADPQTDPAGGLANPVFNGDFEWQSTAGWRTHGGGASEPAIEPEHRWATLRQASSLTHQFIWFEPQGTFLQLDLMAEETDPDDRLVVELVDRAGRLTPIAELPLPMALRWARDVPLSIPESARGRAHTLRFRHAPAGSGSADVSIDNVTILNAAPLPRVALSLAPPTRRVVAGSPAVYEVGLLRANAAGPVLLSATGLPAGYSASFLPNPVAGASSTLTIHVPSGAPAAARFTVSGLAPGVQVGSADGLVEVSVVCGADWDGSGSVRVEDIFAFLGAWFAADTRADFDASGGTPDVVDIFAFLGAWFAGCP